MPIVFAFFLSVIDYLVLLKSEGFIQNTFPKHVKCQCQAPSMLYGTVKCLHIKLYPLFFLLVTNKP